MIPQDALNALFPSDPQTGDINFQNFANPNIGMKWHTG